MSVFTKSKKQGSMTVEASLALPIFIYAISAFMYFFQLIVLQTSLQAALTEVGKHYSENACLYQKIMDDVSINPNENIQWVMDKLEIKECLEGSLCKQKLKHHINIEQLDRSIIIGGFHGLHIELAQDYFESDVVDLILSYDCKIPVLFYPLNTISCMQRVHMKNWTGYAVDKKYKESNGDTSNEEYVYITETGKVYHLFYDCTHIKLSIKKISESEVKTRKNKNNQWYQPCSICCKSTTNSSSSPIFITDYGECYHKNRTCSKIKRSVKTISLVQAKTEGRNSCARCNKRKEKEELQEKAQKSME